MLIIILYLGEEMSGSIKMQFVCSYMLSFAYSDLLGLTDLGNLRVLHFPRLMTRKRMFDLR